MEDLEDFAERLRRFVERAKSKAEAARQLGVSRMDLHRYLSNMTTPRPSRRSEMIRLMGARKARANVDAEVADRIGIPQLNEENVTLLRAYLLHLVSLIDLDAAYQRRD